MSKLFLLSLGAFVVTRFFFLANYPHFYDSPEYYRQSLSGDFFVSIKESHESVHPVYLFFCQLFQRLSAPAVWPVSFVSAIFGLVGFITFYILSQRLFGQKVALLSLLPLIFFPHLWLIQTNVLHEAVEQNLFLLGLLLLDIFLVKERPIWLLSAISVWSVAVLNFSGIVIWFPAILGLSVLRSGKIRWGAVSALASLLGGIFLLGVTLYLGRIDPSSRLKTLLIDAGGKTILMNWSFINSLRTLRNSWLILTRGYSVIAPLGIILLLFSLLQQKKFRILLFFTCFLTSFFITAKFWYGGLFGRYGAFIAYPLAWFMGLIKQKKLYWLVIFSTLLTFIPVLLSYRKTPVPLIQAKLIASINVTKNDLLILSDYQRPQLPYPNAYYLNYRNQDQIENIIGDSLGKNMGKNKRVFITQQAIWFPYWQYDGQLIHIVSKGNKDRAQLKKFLEDKRLELKVSDFNYPLLSIYQIRPLVEEQQ